jgi:TonB family protein
LLEQIVMPDMLRGYQVTVRRALHDESEQRAQAVENGTPVIEVMADENSDAHSGTRPPRPYRRVKPDYPETAAVAEVEAIVDALVDIDEKGEIGRVEIARWAGYGLDQSVIDTIKQLHFFPAMRNGVAIPMRVLLRYNFRKPTQNRLP